MSSVCFYTTAKLGAVQCRHIQPHSDSDTWPVSLNLILQNHPAIEVKSLFTPGTWFSIRSMCRSPFACLLGSKHSGHQAGTQTQVSGYGAGPVPWRKSLRGSLTWWVRGRLEYPSSPTLLVSVPGKGWLPTLPATLVHIFLPHFDAGEN